MDNNTAATRAYAVDEDRREDGWTVELAASEVGAKLSGGLSLIAVLALSLALWAALWAVISSLAAPVSG